MRFRTTLFLAVLAVVAGYFLFEASGVLFSPSLSIEEPRFGDRVHATYTTVAGHSSPAIDVWVNGQILRTDDSGFFKTTVALFPGYNPIEVRVKNRFGYEKRSVTAVILE